MDKIDTLEIVLIIVAAFFAVMSVVSFFIGVAYRKKIAEAEIGSAEEKAKSIIKEAEKDGEAKKRELMLEAKEENQKLRTESEKEIKELRECNYEPLFVRYDENLLYL